MGTDFSQQHFAVNFQFPQPLQDDSYNIPFSDSGNDTSISDLQNIYNEYMQQQQQQQDQYQEQHQHQSVSQELRSILEDDNVLEVVQGLLNSSPSSSFSATNLQELKGQLGSVDDEKLIELFNAISNIVTQEAF